MKKIRGIFPKIYDFENLFCAYKAAIKCKRYRQDVMEYTDRLEDNLIILQNELIWGQYSVGRYNIFYVYEPKKTPDNVTVIQRPGGAARNIQAGEPDF